jgi:alkylation response protein AidB-like acyl-CoA dehydrogenase
MPHHPFLSLERTLYGAEHEAFRKGLREFAQDHVAPGLDRWERQGHVDRALWRRAGAAGYLCMTLPAQYGGAGRDFRYNAILREELARVGVSGTALGMGLHSDVVVPFLWRNGSDAQKDGWLPAMCRGEVIGALAMTEPDAGSDLKAITTYAHRVGDEYVINGSKIFITNGTQADLILLVAKTDLAAGAKGVSVILVEGDRPGLRRGEPMQKLSLRCEDTCELFFDDLRVPAANLLGAEGEGFAMLMAELPWERLQIALSAQAAAEAALEWTLAYVAGRKVFGQTLAGYQNTRFTLADCATEVQLGRLMIDRCVELACAGTLDNTSAAMAKLWCTELQGRVTDACLQLHGGYGVLWNQPIARAYADARVQRIYAGTNEIMREIIARQLWPRA